jgi:hypothetical protein
MFLTFFTDCCTVYTFVPDDEQESIQKAKMPLSRRINWNADHVHLGHRRDISHPEMTSQHSARTVHFQLAAHLLSLLNVPSFNNDLHAIHRESTSIMYTTFSSIMNVFMVFALLRKGGPGSLVSV